MFRYLSFIFTAVFFMTICHHGFSAVSSKRKLSRVSTTSLIIKYDEVTGYDQIFLRTSLYEDIPLTHSSSDKLVVMAGPRVGGFVAGNSISFHEDVCDAGWLFYYSDVSGGVYVGCVDEALNVVADIEIGCDGCDAGEMGHFVVEYPDSEYPDAGAWEDESLPNDFTGEEVSDDSSGERADGENEENAEESDEVVSESNPDQEEEDGFDQELEEDSQSSDHCSQDDQEDDSAAGGCACQVAIEEGDVIAQVDFDLDIDFELVGSFSDDDSVEVEEDVETDEVEENLTLADEEPFGFEMTGGACSLSFESRPPYRPHYLWISGLGTFLIFLVTRRWRSGRQDLGGC